MGRDVGVYVHVPFCPAKCHYCDFNSYAGLDHLAAGFVEAVAREIGALPHERPFEALTARTINLGGGTPSTLSAAGLARILAAMRDRCDVSADAEVSLEANPGTVAEANLAAFREIGFNRISFGVQSFDPRILTSLGRIHTVEQAERARIAARAAGFDTVNLDFIYGLPEQSMATWRATLDRALDLRPEHLSLYALTVEPGTLFHSRAERGLLPLPDEDLVADMYEVADKALATAGYRQYEISNWALDDRYRCQHNLGYWHNREYLGVGPGAHSWYGGRRYWGVRSPRAWMERLGSGASTVAGCEEISPAVALGETMMLGLRLNIGVDLAEVSRRFGLDVAAHYAAVIRECADAGLAEREGTTLRLTRGARLIGNEVFRRFVAVAPPSGGAAPLYVSGA